MEKIWYIKIYGKREGPYSIIDLKRDRRITPDTLVWRKGFDCWQPIRYVPELQIIFEEDEAQIEKEFETSEKEYPDDEIVIDMDGGPPFKWLVAAMLALFFLYVWVQIWK